MGRDQHPHQWSARHVDGTFVLPDLHQVIPALDLDTGRFESRAPGASPQAGMKRAFGPEWFRVPGLV